MIFFDLDGTLLDTLDDLADSCNEALASIGLNSLPPADYRYHVGAGARNLAVSALASALSLKEGRVIDKAGLENSELSQKVYTAFRSNYKENWAKKTKPYDGVQLMLDKLKKQGRRLAVISNKPDDFTRLMVEHYFGNDQFDLVAGLSDQWPAKPDPSLSLHMCRQLGMSPDQSALIGDSGSDMVTAVNAGFKALGVLWGFRDRAELEQGGADLVFSEVSQLSDYLLK